MKAYQLKIMLKNSKPPIWRRCIVPAGLTFSQLSMVLNEVMGWEGYHLFKFEFYHLELEIMEDDGDLEIQSKYDFAEASCTYINEYMEQEKWFAYIYDFGDYWQHRVTIENVLPDYEYAFPKVIKFKGDCPMEDAGGIEQYYHHLKVLNDPSDPEYEVIKNWVANHAHYKTYDLDKVNEQLEKYEITYGRGETRRQEQLYKEFYDGKIGFEGSKSGKNKCQPERSSWHRMHDSMQKFADNIMSLTAFRDGGVQDIYPREIKLADIFKQYTKDILLEYADTYELSGCSSLKKNELVLKLSEHMLEETVMNKWFSCMRDDEMESFEKLLAQPEIESEGEEELLSKAYDLGYVGCTSEGIYFVPKDVGDVYARINTPKFHAVRKRRSFLLDCLYFAADLYGVFSFDTLAQMMEKSAMGANLAGSWKTSDIRTEFREIPSYLREFELLDDQIIDRILSVTGNYHYLLEMQKDIPFYYPTWQEIDEYSTYQYFPKDKYFLRLKEYVEDLLRVDGYDRIVSAESLCAAVQVKMMSANVDEATDIIGYLIEALGLEFRKQGQRLTDLATKLWNNTRKIIHRGHTPNELRNIIQSKKVQSGQVINMQERKKAKVYANDPCPCGSGKKYKRCCAKK